MPKIWVCLSLAIMHDEPSLPAPLIEISSTSLLIQPYNVLLSLKYFYVAISFITLYEGLEIYIFRFFKHTLNI